MDLSFFVVVVEIKYKKLNEFLLWKKIIHENPVCCITGEFLMFDETVIIIM